jgi:3-methyladenine DNA glycosylase AlkD
VLQVEQIRNHFRKIGTRQRAVGEKKYLKSRLMFFGVPVPEVRKAARQFKKEHPHFTRQELLRQTQAMWTDYHEMRTVSIAILEQYVQLLRGADIAFVEKLIRRSEGWSHVDFLAVQIAGPIVQKYKSARKLMTRWSRDESFWIRRSSMLSLILELRSEDGDFELFAGFADGMLDEKELFIRKSIGWVLREASKARPELVYDYLLNRIKRVSGLTLRVGSKRLPKRQRERLLALYAKK